MKKRLLLSVLSIMIAVVVYFINDGVYMGYAAHVDNKLDAEKIQDMYRVRIEQREERFRNNPNLMDCVILLENYYWDLHEYGKALYYGEYCLRLGVDNTPRAWHVHILLADIYAKNKNWEKACYHFDLALKEAKVNKIPESQFKEFEIQDLVDSCKRKQEDRKP